MSALPAAVPSQKRPLEEPSSDSGLPDQPDAKRPALELKSQNVEGDQVAIVASSDGVAETETAETTKAETTNGEPHNGANTATDGTSNVLSAAAVLETQPIQSTTTANASGSSSNNYTSQHQDETGWLHIRSIISSAEAATVIGKGGENVSLIRRMSGAKCTVSDYTRGAVERVLTVSGLVDAVAKVSLIYHCP